MLLKNKSMNIGGGSSRRVSAKNGNECRESRMRALVSFYDVPVRFKGEGGGGGGGDGGGGGGGGLLIKGRGVGV